MIFPLSVQRVARLLLAYRKEQLRIAYSDEQPRDDWGRWVDEGGNNSGISPASNITLDAQAKAGVAAVAPLVEQATKNADYSNAPASGDSWDDLPSDKQNQAEDLWKQNNSEIAADPIDTSSIDQDYADQLRADNQDVVDRAEKATLDSIAKSFPNTEATLPLGSDVPAFEQFHTLDPATLIVGEDTGDGAPLDRAELRFTNGQTLTEEQANLVEGTWEANYSRAFDYALSDVYSSDAGYQEQVGQAQSQADYELLQETWDNFSDSQKLSYAQDNGISSTGVDPGPFKWTSGLNGDAQSTDYARSGAVASELVRLRTNQILEDRNVTVPGYGRPGYTTVLGELDGHILVKDPSGVVIASFNPKSYATSQELESAIQNAVNGGLGGKAVSAETIITPVWDSWKTSSSSGIGLALQYAAQQELGGVGRLTADEIKQATEAAAAEGFGIDGLKAYVRAQWEVNQYVLSQSGEKTVDVYRGIMLPQSKIAATEQTPIEVTTDTGYFRGEYTRLPDIQVLRAGAQSTTSDESVANSWDGVGDVPANSQRVVLRISAPASSVLSLPIYGKNVQGEHEIVLAGTKDRWQWDAWVGTAPTYEAYPMPHQKMNLPKAASLKPLPLVIDLQALDRGKPHWLSGVRNLRVGEFNPDQARFRAAYSEDQPRDEIGRWTDSSGSSVAVTDPSFQSWFAGSKVVDASGQPTVVYHQTSAWAASKIRFEGFRTDFGRARLGDERVPDGIFFKPTAANIGLASDTPVQIPVYLSIKNPLLSIHPDRERVIKASEATPAVLAKFALDNADLLRLPTKYLGGWHKPENGLVYLDVSTIVPDAASAERLAREANQYAYYDLTHGHSVEIIHQRAAQGYDHTQRHRPLGRYAHTGRHYQAVQKALGARAHAGRNRRSAADFRSAYSDDQPRDDHGRWTDTGAGSPASAPAAGTGIGVSRPTPNQTIAREATAFAQAHGFWPVSHPYVAVDQSRAGRIADAYDALPVDDSHNPAVIQAYTALGGEINTQWDFATSQGMTFEPWTKPGQPYQTSIEMAKDVADNRHMFFYTGGDPHPFLSQVDPKTGFTLNDKFRAVHDYFGHAAGGYGFGPRGEENAWIAHSQMFSMDARRALTTETRGQNSWVNFGKQNYNADGSPKNISPADRPFATQKVALLPDEFVQLPSGALKTLGGSGSGNFGHAGRPGEVGGSSTEGAIADAWDSGHLDNLNLAESRIRNEPVEHGFVVREGSTEYFSSGSRDHIDLPSNLTSWKDQTFTHNHPGGSAFSPEDIALAVNANLKEIRAVVSDGVYRMVRVGDVWPNRDLLQHLVNTTAASVTAQFKDKIAKKVMTNVEANKQHWATIWKRVTSDPDVRGRLQFSFEPKS